MLLSVLNWRSASCWDIINTQNCLFSNFNGTNLFCFWTCLLFLWNNQRFWLAITDQIDHYQQFWLVVTIEQYNVILWWLLLIYFQNQYVMIIFAKSAFVFGIEKQKKINYSMHFVVYYSLAFIEIAWLPSLLEIGQPFFFNIKLFFVKVHALRPCFRSNIPLSYVSLKRYSVLWYQLYCISFYIFSCLKKRVHFLEKKRNSHSSFMCKRDNWTLERIFLEKEYRFICKNVGRQCNSLWENKIFSF